MTNLTQANDGSHRLREFLTSAITEGAYPPGARLPTERHLAEQFGVTRTVARGVLAQLEAENRIRRHVGRGTFVEPPPDLEHAAISCNVPMGSISPAEYIETRLRFEPELAWMIVTSATAGDFERMEWLLTKGERASTREEFELADATFHQALAAATHNKLAIAMYEIIHSIRHEHHMWSVLRVASKAGDQREVFQREHVRIVEALKQRDAETGRELMAQHIRATRRRMLDV
ncbi:MAG: FCD domain-containing protein [Alphaproteobacteria bacterium]|nr:FCD domain-containing protein [Alphaproteobacteria bacterium]